MKRALKKMQEKRCWYFVDGQRIDGVHERIWGEVSGIRGEVSGIWGEVSGIRGDVSGIRGDVSRIRGDVDDCRLTDEERKNGVDIADLLEAPAELPNPTAIGAERGE